MNAVNPQPRKNEGARARDLEEKMKASELVLTVRVRVKRCAFQKVRAMSRLHPRHFELYSPD
jgi:hypothetical protein